MRTAAVRAFFDVLIVLHNLDSCEMHRYLGFPSVVPLVEDSSVRGVHHQRLVLDETRKIGKGRFKPIFLDCCCVTQPSPLEFEWQAFNNLLNYQSYSNLSNTLDQGWVTPGTRAELGTRALLSGTWARPRKRDTPPSNEKVNEKVNNLQVAVLSDEARCPFLHFRLLTICY